MPDSKIEIKVGTISFSGEGPGEWLGKQLDKVLAKIPELVKVADVVAAERGDEDKDVTRTTTPNRGKLTLTLAAFLKEKKATTNQVRKFLATAMWLHDHGGQKRVTTAEVSTALNAHNQGKLTNAALALIRNAGRGMIVKDGKTFYVSDEGRTELEK